jgi:hypothetical protein
MGMQDFNVDRLSLSLGNVQGHEHRVQPIASRAAAIFAERVEACCGEDRGASSSRNLGSVSAEPLSVDLAAMTDEQAAQSIAKAWLDAVALSLV